MRAHLQRLRARIGDFWWYSLMIFCACRAADLLNAFVGLWLVPKYVDPAELGAVMPLAQFATFLALPMSVFASTFRNELTTLAVNRKYGQMKTLMRGVFIATAVFFVLALVVARICLPMYLERIRIAEGSLGFLIIFASFAGTVAPIYQNAIQSLKKFRGFSIINILGAPIRLVMMVLTMPFRALSGYFVGQASTPLFQIVASLVCLRKDLAVKAEPYWSRAVVRRFLKLFLLLAIGSVVGGFSDLVPNTILRQRLPSIDSAGFYMATRFSDIASFLAITLLFTMFPYAAEANAKSKSMRPLILKIDAALVAFAAALAGLFCLFGERILILLPHGAEYAGYWWVIPWMIAITTINYMYSAYASAELAANRFGYYWWAIPLTAVYPALLLFVTGYGYFTPYLPAGVSAFLAAHNITSLKTMLVWMTAFSFIRLACAFAAMFCPVRHPHDRTI